MTDANPETPPFTILFGTKKTLIAKPVNATPDNMIIYDFNLVFVMNIPFTFLIVYTIIDNNKKHLIAFWNNFMYNIATIGRFL